MVGEKTSNRLTGWGSFREAFVSARGIVVHRFVLATLATSCAVLASLAFATAPALANACANERFRQGPSAALPDCRAYEMVSPPNKNGGEVDGGLFVAFLAAPEQASETGEAVTYGSTSVFLETGADSGELTSQYLSKRTSSGWTTQAITPRQQVPEGDFKPSVGGQPEWSLFQGFDETLSSAYLLAWNPQPVSSAPEGYFNPYLRDNEDGKFSLLSSEVPQVWEPGPIEFEEKGFSALYAGMTPDAQHVIFEANEALTPEAVPGKVNLYEWSAGRPLELVSVLPNGEASLDGVGLTGQYGSLKFGMGPVEGQGVSRFNYSGALSSNGKRVFWSAGGKVYMSEMTSSGARSVEMSASQKGAGGPGSGLYWTANATSSLVYFTSGEQLTDDSTATPEKPDLYQYDVETGMLTDLTVDDNPGESAAVQGVLGSGESEGIPYVYFVANGVLGDGAQAGATPGTCEHVNSGDTDPLGVGACNLYVSQDGEIRYIARLGNGYDDMAGGEEADFTEQVMSRTSRVSPDGRLLAFQSELPLTGYDNIPASGACPLPQYEDEPEVLQYRSGEGRCMEVFEYDAQSGRLSCASCNPNGLPPSGESFVPGTSHPFAHPQGWQSSTVQQRYLLDNGRLFFDSEDALLPQATDGRRNVYEYEPEGVGGCATSGAGSCLYLISTGISSADSSFMDASANGRDVFFLTRQRLVPEDGDEAVDVYDAREGGGLTQASPPPCAGEACKPAVTPAPAIYGAPSSASFEGAGNQQAPVAPVKAKAKVKAKQCKRGFVRKKGRCVRKPRARKASNRRGSK